VSGGAAVPELGDVGGVEGGHCRWQDPVALHVAYHALDGGGRAALELAEAGRHPAVVRTLVEMAAHLAGGAPGDDNAITEDEVAED